LSQVGFGVTAVDNGAAINLTSFTKGRDALVSQKEKKIK